MSLFHIIKKHSYAKDQTYMINVIMLIKTLGNHLDFFLLEMWPGQRIELLAFYHWIKKKRDSNRPITGVVLKIKFKT